MSSPGPCIGFPAAISGGPACPWARSSRLCGKGLSIAKSGDRARRQPTGEDDAATRVWLTAREAALQLGVHEKTIRRAIERGELTVVKQSGKFRIPPAAITRYQSIRDERRFSARRPTSSPLESRVSTLPVPPTSLVGRTREVDAALALLGDPEVRLLTLTGPGGVGKTRLALAVAAAMAPNVADGVVFVPLESIRDPDLVVHAIAHALGIPKAVDRPLLSTMREAVHRRRQLLVLDNFEQVLPAGGVVADLLAAGPFLRVLVTSREVVRIRGEHEFIVRPLILPDPADNASAESVGRAPAVELFVNRARAVRPDFTLTESNAAVVGAVCQRLDGLPLAIELAAARVKHASIAELQERLEQRLDLLTGGARDLPRRLRTMRAAIAWSYDLLTPDEQRLFRRLAVFSGGFEASAVQAVLAVSVARSLANARPGVPETVDRLISLIDKSLIQQEEPPDGPRRYRLLETIREFAGEQLSASGEEDFTRAQHAAHYLAMAEAAARDYHGPAEGAAFTRMESDLGNFRAALDWATSEDGNIELGLRMAHALWWFWYVRGYHREGSMWLETLRTHPHADAWPAARAYAAVAAGWLAMRQVLPQHAKDLHADALARFRRLGDEWGASFALGGLGYVAIACEGDPVTAATFLSEALTGGPVRDDRWLEAVLSFGLTLCALMHGNIDTAQTMGERTLALSRASGDAQGTAATLSTLGQIARGRGDTTGALKLFGEALELFQRIEDRGNVCMCVDSLAGLLVSLGQAGQGAYLFGTAAALRQRIGTPVSAHDLPGYEADMAAARAALGAEVFAGAFAAGEATPLHAALTGTDWATPALHDPDGTHGTTGPSSAKGVASLTRREREVLQLVAEGHTDREIGQLLSISPATVTKHVGNVLSKLGVRSRAVAAVALLLAGPGRDPSGV